MEHVNMSAWESIIADQLQGMGFELEAVERHNSPGADPDGGQRFLADVKTRARHSVYEACGKDRRRCPCALEDRKSTRLNSSHVAISYAVFCSKKKTTTKPCTCPPADEVHWTVHCSPTI